MAERIDVLMHQLFKTSDLTFNEWVVITQAVVLYTPDPCLPLDYTKARASLLKEEG